MKITVIGTGYVGLVTGTCLAETGNDVICIDINVDKINKLQAGEILIYEPHLEVIFKRNIKSKRLKFSTFLKEGLDHGEVIFLALPTPEDEEGAADLKYISEVAEDIGKLIDNYKIIVNKSTVPVGTARKVRAIISKHTKTNFDVVSNPEFLREGSAVDDFLKPERIVVGSHSDKAIAIMKKLYKPFVRSGNPILIMDEKSAELTKYAANTFLATKITFMNEIANLCEKVGADVDMVRRGIGTDSRIGNRFLFSGIGYGGSCFPKDVKALHKITKDEDYTFEILEAVMKVNQVQKTILIPKIKHYFKENLSGKKIGVWGLSFKPNTDDIREAPALYHIEALLELGVHIIAFDPEAMSNVQCKFGNKIDFASNMYEAVKGVDALLICTEWNVFRNPDFSILKKQMKNKVIFDGRNLFQVEEIKEEGFDYYSIGRQS